MGQVDAASNMTDQWKTIDAAGDKIKETSGSTNDAQQYDTNITLSFLPLLHQSFHALSCPNHDSPAYRYDLAQEAAGTKQSADAAGTEQGKNNLRALGSGSIFKQDAALGHQLPPEKGQSKLQANANTTDETGAKKVELNVMDKEQLAFLKNDKFAMLAMKTSLHESQLKEACAGKNSLDSIEMQYLSAAGRETAELKTNLEATQMALKEISDKIKPEHKGKNDLFGKGNEDITSASVQVSGGSAKAMKVNEVEPLEIMRKITAEVKNNAANDGGRVKIILNPPSLGTVEMEVIVNQNKVGVVLVAENTDVQQALNNNIDQLKSSLQTQGLTVDRCDVFMQDKQEGYKDNSGGHSFHRDESGRSVRERPDNSEENAAINIPVSAKRTGILRTTADSISLFA